MRIDIWSDYACPFCYIGKKRLEHALSEFPGKDHVEVVFRSFQLDPSANPAGEVNIHEMLAKKYNMTLEKAQAMNAQLTEQAKGVGLDFRFDTMVHTNTFDAHRLSHYAAKHGKAAEITERLLRAYFTDSLNVGDRSVLAKLAGEVGLDEAEVASVLASDAYSAEVNADIAEGARLNITGVPFFVFNNKYAVSGAQPGPVFTEVLETVWKEEQETSGLQVLGQSGNPGQAAGDDACGDGSCKI